MIDQINDIINPKYLKQEREKNLKFPQEWLKDEMRHNPPNPSEGGVGGLGILNMNT